MLRRAFSTFLLILVIVTSAPAGAYKQSLDSEFIREAYFLGRRMDQTTKDFLIRYTRSFPRPESGPYIARVEILTPYSQIVLCAEKDMVNSSIQDIERIYQTHPKLFLVRVQVYKTPTFFSELQWTEFLRGLDIRVAQAHPLNPASTIRSDTHPASRMQPSFDVASGAEVELKFDAAQISSAPITIDISSPDGQHVEAKFDLDRLK